MKDTKFLIDSNILIYQFNGNNIADNFLRKNKKFSAISRLTFLEVLLFDLTKEQELFIKNSLYDFNIFDTSDSISLQTINNRKIKKIKLVDNIILATAQVNNLTLVTRNTKDFIGFDIKILNPFDN